MKELSGLRSQILKPEIVVERAFVPHCSSGLLIMKFNLLGHVVELSEKIGSLFSTTAAPFQHYTGLTEQSCRTTSWRYSARVYRKTHYKSRVLESLRREEI